MSKTKIELKKLIPLYIFVIILATILIAPTHIFPQPYFMYLRFPHYLEKMPIFLGVSWPMTFAIYHYVFYTLAVIGSFNVLGIIFYPRFKQIVLVSSLIGLFLMPLMVLFFFFVFINVNTLTAIIYGTYSVVLLIVDILTFKALIKEKKVASRGQF